MKLKRSQFISQILPKILSWTIISALIVTSITPPIYAKTNESVNLPAPGTLVLTSPRFEQPMLAGISIYPENPLKFDFIIDTGDTHPEETVLSDEASRLIKYFLVALTVPADQLWVNLSPLEKDRIVADGLGETAMGRDMLTQDYLLKQLTASLLSPEEETGAEYWKRLFAKIDQGLASQISMDTLNKIWIVPAKADVYVQNNKAIVTGARMKVMLEKDYLALQEEQGDKHILREIDDAALNLVREIILPVIEEEVNYGETFANLRQIYSAMILATWFKQNLRTNIINSVYTDQSKTDGVNLADKGINERIYQQYIQALKKGVYNQVREEYDASSNQVIPRKYFSGGVDAREIDAVLSIAESDSTFDNAMLSRFDGRMDSVYVIQAGLADTRGRLSYQQTALLPHRALRKEADRAMLSALEDILRHDQLNVSRFPTFSRIVQLEQDSPNSDGEVNRLMDALADEVLAHAYLQKTVGSFTTPDILRKEVKRVITKMVAESGKEIQSANRLSRKVVRPINELMVAISLRDVGAVINAQGQIDYENSLQKTKALLPSLARDGVKQVYLYGGLYDTAAISKQLHQLPDRDVHYMSSDDGRVLVRMRGYQGKQAKVTGAGVTESLYDAFGNNFSVYSLNRFNPKMGSKLVSDGKEEALSSQKTMAELQDLTQTAKEQGITIIADFVPWLAPDAVNDDRLSWTAHRRLSDKWDEGQIADYRAASESERLEYHKQILDEETNDFIYIADDGLPVLVQHFFYGQNKDQVYLNLFLPEVREYYTSSLKNLIDLGVEGVRVDLAHFLLNAHLRRTFDPQDDPNKEPLLEIMHDIGDYAREKGQDFTFVMETYFDDEKNQLLNLGKLADVKVQVYHKGLEDAYVGVVREGKSAQEVGEALNAAFKLSVEMSQPRRIAPATFDDQSMANVGGPVSGMSKLVLLMSEFGVPTMFDLREWVQHKGHIISIVGGISEDGIITHPYVTEEEFEQRMTDGGLARIIDELPWNDFTARLQAYRQEGDRLIRQKHADYPWYIFDYADKGQRTQFVTVGWENDQGLQLFVLNMRPGDYAQADVRLPQKYQEAWGRDSVPISFGLDQQVSFVSLSKVSDQQPVQVTDIESVVFALPDSATLSEQLSYYQTHIDELRGLIKRAQDESVSIPAKDLQVLQQFMDLQITQDDLRDFQERGTSNDIYRKLGSHPIVVDGEFYGTYFAVWAPNSRGVNLTGDFNNWRHDANVLQKNTPAGIWYGYVPEAKQGDRYKFRIIKEDGNIVEKTDPYAVYGEYPTADEPTRSASRVWHLSYQWNDAQWLKGRRKSQSLDSPLNIYELHIGSWRKKFENGEWKWLTYRELADQLIPYLKKKAETKGQKFTHVELMPPMEHSYYPSWGYQVGSYFAPSARYGTPQDLKYLIDQLHQNDIGVLIDWVPAHFPKDENGLSSFDGSELYSHQDSRQGEHPDWGTRIFNYGRHEVRSFLLSNANFWLKEYHVDGIRVDAVSSMLYLDYGREAGQWIPNQYGGRENLDAIALLRDFNQMVHHNYPGVITAAEESTDWPDITTPIDDGGLGFTYKWSMGWMHDILEYMSEEPVHRKHHHNLLTFYPHYAFSENFILPLSHDEVVHLKKSLLEKMPGDEFQRFANLRLLFGYMATMPGKKLMFMGGEMAQPGEWDPDHSLPWNMLDYPYHQGIDKTVSQLFGLIGNEPALHELDVDPRGFQWIDASDSDRNIISFTRQGMDPNEQLMVVFNFSDVAQSKYRVGASWGGEWEQIFSTNDEQFGGSGAGIVRTVNADEAQPMHDKPASVELELPPLTMMIFKGRKAEPQKFLRVPNEGLLSKSELKVVADVAFRDVRGGYVEDGNRKVKEGDTVTLQAVANRPDFDGTREVYLHSNRNITGKWRREKVPAKFIENRNGRAIYEVSVKARRNFEYTFVFVGEDGEEEWADIPEEDNKKINYRVEVEKTFEGSVAYVGMEFAPLIKVGGQADVMYELPKALAKAGNDVTVILPHFKSKDYQLDEFGFEDVEGVEIEIPFNNRGNVRLTAKKAVIDGIQVYILDADADDLFARTYENQGVEFYDSVLLSRGSLELLKALGKQVDVVNSADHHTALIPLYMRSIYANEFSKTGSVFTIHNNKYQGWYPQEWYHETGLPDTQRIRDLVIKNHQLNMMAAPPGVIKHIGAEGNFVNTVSVGYANEIRHAYFEIDRLLRDIGHRFDGILNGLDFGYWDPDTDPYLFRNYSVADPPEVIAEARAENKLELQQILAKDGDKSKLAMKDPANVHGELKVGSKRMLIGAVSRLVDQKQIDIIAEMLEDMYAGRKEKMDIDFVLNGTGDGWIEERLKEIATDARKHNVDLNVVFVNEYVQILTQKMMSAVDALLIPSDFEPSGLTQMQAMRYGTIPIVRKTGGLADTVFEGGDDWNGFVFDGTERVKDYSEEDVRRRRINTDGLYDAIARAYEIFTNEPTVWQEIIQRAMLSENDWRRSLGDYMNVYAWLTDEMHRDLRGGTIKTGDVTTQDKGTVTLQVETHSTDRFGERKVYLRSNRSITGEWITEKEHPARYVKTVDGRDTYEIQIEARRSFEYTFVFEYPDSETVEPELPEGHPRVMVKSDLEGTVAFVGMEFAPLVKIGGQGDVMYELPKNLASSGGDVLLVLPKFKGLADKLEGLELEEIEDWSKTFEFKHRSDVTVKAYRTEIQGIKVILLDTDADDLFDTPYKDRSSEFYESVILSKGSVDLLSHLKKQGADIKVVNSADHHTALVSLYMRTEYKHDFDRTGSVYTIHNIGYQGRYSEDLFDELGVNEMYKPLIQSGNQLNMMSVPANVMLQLGMQGNFINTVSPSYARETRPVSFDREVTQRILQLLGNRYSGILNGLDFSLWDPANDPYIHKQYSITDGIDSVLTARAENKRDLQEILADGGDTSKIGLKDPDNLYGKLKVDAQRMLIGSVGRLVDQKQMDIIGDIIDDMIAGRRERLPIDFVLNGTGNEHIKQQLADVARRAQEANLDMSYVFVNEYLDAVTRKILAGADAFLVPSDYEPSGLTQMQAMRYGAVPIVRRTGGLADTVSELADNWLGFVFDGVPRFAEDPDIDRERRGQNAYELYEATSRAVDVYYNDPERWKEIIEKDMKADNDWSRSLGDYINVYKWLYDELKLKADPGFTQMAKELSDRYQTFISSDSKPDRPFVLAIRGNYASGKSMLRQALIEELSGIGINIEFEHDQSDINVSDGAPSFQEAMVRHRDAQILIYEIEKDLPPDPEHIDMLVRMQSDIPTVQRRIQAEMDTWEHLQERVLDSLAAADFIDRRPDLAIRLTSDLTDDEFKEYIRNGLNEMSFSRAESALEANANARVVDTEDRRAIKENVDKEIQKKIPSKSSGVLMHISSLASSFGIGDFGPAARDYIDFLEETGQNTWQVLPLNMTDGGSEHSPYSSVSAFALNPLFISPEMLVEQGLITTEEAEESVALNTGEVNYAEVEIRKRHLLGLAYSRIEEIDGVSSRFETFKRDNADWLPEFLLFEAIRETQGNRFWNEWPEDLSDRNPEAISNFQQENGELIDRIAFDQFLLFEQWAQLRDYAKLKGINIMGDLPLYVSYNSAEVWAHSEYFDLDENKNPITVSGAPPDQFTDDGQRWGHPTFRWDVLRAEGYDWFMRRIAHNLYLFDELRLDHFRGYVKYWEIPAEDDTAVNGKWVDGVDDSFYEMLQTRFGIDRFIAEDLGDITPDVEEIIDRYKFRNMKVLQFGFDGDVRKNPYHPRKHTKRNVVYTGTHDNNTLKGWFRKEVDLGIQTNIQRFLSKEVSEVNIHWEFIQMALQSASEMAIIPMQDILGLGEEARINLPGTDDGNWRWRMADDAIDESITLLLADVKQQYHPKLITNFNRMRANSLIVRRAISYLRANNYHALAERLENFVRHGKVREGAFLEFSSTVHEDEDGEEYILVSSVGADAEALSQEEKIANLIFAAGAIKPFHLPYVVNSKRAQEYIDQAMMTDEQVGGIDFNPDLMELNIKGEASYWPQPAFNGMNPADLKIEGFVPVIINITPMQSIPFYFGETNKLDEFKTSKIDALELNVRRNNFQTLTGAAIR